MLLQFYDTIVEFNWRFFMHIQKVFTDCVDMSKFCFVMLYQCSIMM